MHKRNAASSFDATARAVQGYRTSIFVREGKTAPGGQWGPEEKKCACVVM
jgi:hypothetical protein